MSDSRQSGSHPREVIRGPLVCAEILTFGIIPPTPCGRGIHRGGMLVSDPREWKSKSSLCMEISEILCGMPLKLNHPPQ